MKAKLVKVVSLLDFCEYAVLDFEEACDLIEDRVSFGDADDTLLTVSRLCEILNIEEPDMPESVFGKRGTDLFIGLGS